MLVLVHLLLLPLFIYISLQKCQADVFFVVVNIMMLRWCVFQIFNGEFGFYSEMLIRKPSNPSLNRLKRCLTSPTIPYNM